MSSNNFNITTIESYGIYFEKTSDVHFNEQHWTIISFLNLSFVYDRQILIDNVQTKLEKLCSNHIEINCQNTFYLLKDRIINLKNSYTNYLYLIGKFFRVKRGWFNIVGSGLKTLFGTLDQEDSNYYDSAITELQEKQTDTLRIMQDQLSILSTTYKDFNLTITNMNRIEKEINDVIDKINRFKYTVETEINKNINNEYNSELIMYLNVLITEAEIDINKIIDIILFAKTGQIHPGIISPEQFVKELIYTKAHLPKDLVFPIPLKIENVHLILRICQVVSYVDNNNLVFVIKVPITTNEKFELFNMIPIPQTNILNIVIIKLTKKFLLISETKTKFVLIDDLSECKDIGYEKICRPITMKNPYNFITCETELFLQNRLSPECDNRVLNSNIEIFHKLSKLNSWLYLLTHETTLTIDCGKVENIKLSKTGIVTIFNKNCRAFTYNYMLIPDLELKMNYENRMSNINLKEENCCVDENLKYSIALSPLENIDLKFVNLHDLSNSAHKITVANNRISEILSKPHPARHFSTLTYIVALILLILISYAIYKCRNSGSCKFIIKLCCFNNWFHRRDQTNPVVYYRREPIEKVVPIPRKPIRSKSQALTVHGDSEEDAQYRFD